ncbi:hypothetical protein D9758_000062 [Tetrapyrgos nigripes]|uniref:C3H1-type domain-containing protein n=1 Tax=Tetrapyrgos nigripes TaxID=182062 RepID=A0A8H5H1V3_9AGAR|nr:hypothetical protein D9758_000062 [Tetrapyrgos nigripes]
MDILIQAPVFINPDSLLRGSRPDMDGDDSMSYLDTPAGDYIEQSSYEKQTSVLQTYLNSVPYECESIEDMKKRLEEIVGKIYICAKSQNWLTLTTWDGMLQCWLLMRYPMQKSTRAKLVRLYYELCIVSGVEPRVIRSWADMLSRLLANKSGSKRKLETTDLQLPWRPLWKALKKELWVKKRIQDPSRNVVNILLYVAEQCKRYYPADEIPNMLDEFLPLVTQDSILTMIPILTSFLPPTHCHVYMPALFKVWEAFNSAVLDDRLLELAGELSQEHVAGAFGDNREGNAKWKDVGIWSEKEWNMLVVKGLGSMNVPVGITRGASTTASHADSMADRQSLKIKKSISRQQALAKIIVYSISADGPVREVGDGKSRAGDSPQGYLAGSRALDTLERLITSTESFFHPSNSGTWSGSLTSFLQRLTGEFTQRWHEEQQPTCKIPVMQRLTPALRRAFVNTLRTPALLAMFSKDPISLGLAQGSLRAMALLEPNIIMPELLERAYGGLEVVNETHRTTAVLSMLTGIARPLTTEKVWLSGQKHVVPLLELCIPGIDVNDPNKTIFTTMFVSAILQNIKVGDLSIHQSGHPLTEDFNENMDVDQDTTQLPAGTEAGMPALSRSDERALVRDSTAAFADWVTSLFRRVLALYEYLPEEGGKRNTTGGKTEEGVLRSIKGMMDVVCLHLSDQLFDLVLKLVYDYATTNAKSNAVRAFGQLISCLARVKPERTLDKFLPFCVAQIEEELKHGASSIRTTSSHSALAADTTLHWNLTILRGCLGYGGQTLARHREQIINLMLLLIDKTKSERGYSGSGQLITRVLYTLTGIYPTNSRFVNSDEWLNPEFDQDHNLHWGKFYKPEDAVIDWHVPSDEEIAFVLEVLDRVADPTLSKIEALLETTQTWNNADRNDFCRYLQACRSIWSGLPTFLKEQIKDVVNPCLYDDIESLDLLVPRLDVEAGFTLRDPTDQRYQKALQAKLRFGGALHRAAALLRQKTEGEDHIDAVISVSKAIDVYLLDYAVDKNHFDSLQKSYTSSRDMNRVWPNQNENSRLVYVKRAQMYHSGRVYMHSLYRRRSALDDLLIGELVESALSPYTRVRRNAQSILQSVYGVYHRSTRATLPVLLRALSKGNDPDRMKGALYVLSHKGIMSYALVDQGLHQEFLVALLESQHEEKPSVQKVVNNLAQDCLTHLNEEVIHTDAYSLQTRRVEEALEELRSEFSSALIDQKLLEEALAKRPIRVEKRNALYHRTVSSILEIACRANTHWRYVQMSCRFLYGLLRRDVAFPSEAVNFFLEHTISPQPSIRLCSQRAITKLLAFVKFRTYAQSAEELWSEEWKSPLREDVHISDPEVFAKAFQHYTGENTSGFVDKVRTGFLTWEPVVKGYKSGTDDSPSFVYEATSLPSLQVIKASIQNAEYFKTLSGLWSQESGKTNAAVELRSENVLYMKSLAKVFEEEILDALTATMEPIICDPDRFMQRAAGEILTGLLRGSKHWQPKALNRLWTWTTNHLDRIFNQIKPDTLSFWESVFSYVLEERDPRRNGPLVNWILNLPLNFHAESALAMSKCLTIFEVLVDGLGSRFNSQSDHYINLLFDNANTSYAEIRAHIAQILYDLVKNQWQPWYRSTDAFLQACNEVHDPLRIREAKYQDRISQFLVQLPKWKEERLPPPRVSLSEVRARRYVNDDDETNPMQQYDKVGLTLLQWIWVSAYGAQACLTFPYAVSMMPEILQMSELNDSSDLQTYSTAVLYVLSAVTPVADYVPIILENFVSAIKSSTSWRIRHHAMPALVVFFYRNLLTIGPDGIAKVMDVLLDCLADENVEVREMASKVLSGVVRCSQRQRIIPLKNRFISLIKKTSLPPRGDPSYAQSLRSLHSGVLGLCALIESFPYSVEPWMPPLTEVLAPHVTDPPPISTTIRKCASDFKKTHQDTWHTDQQAFDEDQLQSLSTMLVGTSYYSDRDTIDNWNTPVSITRRAPLALKKLSISPNMARPDTNPVSLDNHGSRWYFNNSGQYVNSDAAGWENLADEIVRLNIGDSAKEGEDGPIRTPPKSKLASAAVIQLSEQSPLETASIPSVGSSPSTSEHQIGVSHSRGSSTDTTFSRESGMSSNNNTMLAQPPLKSGPISEPKERPHSFSGGLSTADLRRLQDAGGSASPDNDNQLQHQQWQIPSEQQQQLSYPSLAPNGTNNIYRPQPQQAYGPLPVNHPSSRDDTPQLNYNIQQRSWDIPQPGMIPTSPPYVQARPNNSLPAMPYRQPPPRTFPQQGLLPSPGYAGPHHTAHLSLGNTQQLYDMMLPGPHDNAHPAVSRVQQQHNVNPFRGAHHHSASDPSALRDAAALALLNNNMPPFTPGMFPGNVAVAHPPAMPMYPGPYYGAQDAYHPDPAAAHAMVSRIQTQFTGPYGMVPSQQSDGGMSSPASTAGGSGPSANNRKLGLYKTELCRSWEEKGSCRYGSKCQFAHGEEELRKVARHPKYKTEICRTFWVSGSCPYGKRCCFIHTELPSSATAAGGQPPADSVPPPPSRADGRARSMSTNSDPNDASGSLLARISAKRTQDQNTETSSTPIETPPPGFSFGSRPPTGTLRVNTSVLDGSGMKQQNKSAYPTFANNGVLLPAQEQITARSPAPVTAGPDLGRHNNSRLEIVGYNQRMNKAGTPPSGRHAPSGSEDLRYSSNNLESNATTPTVNGHVRAGSAGNWAFSRGGMSASAYPHAPSPAGENVNSPWSSTDLMASSRLNEKAWA